MATSWDSAWAQERGQGTVRIEVRSAAGPVPQAAVEAGGATRLTNPLGVALVAAPPGTLEVTISKDGFVPTSVRVEVVSGTERQLLVELTPRPTVEEEVTVVASTRTDRRLEDQPMRVEVLEREEIEEKMLMTPGDIVMMLNEMGGMRVQATSPSLGAASVRIQGMRGRYTRFLSDGLPLFGEQLGGLGLLQIPPMDLGQVEVIKGVASALYGAGAMGGVVNLLSRRPGKARDREVLFNQSTRGATDAVLWVSSPVSETWGVTFLGSAHRQSQTDVNADGWADLPGYTRGVARPRVFWDDGQGRTFFATVGTTWEDRTGGTEPGPCCPPRRAVPRGAGDEAVDAGALGQAIRHGPLRRDVRAASSRQRHAHEFGEALERDRHETAFAELAIRGARGRQRGWPDWRSNATRTARRTCRNSRTRSRRRVSSFRTTSTSAPGCRCRSAAASIITARTAGSSARGSRPSCGQGRGRAACRSGAGFFGAHRAHGRDRGGRALAAGDSRAPSGRTRAQHVGGRHADAVRRR